ncbi:MAG: winged helix-turn-helix domain-containing protein [Xanthomonadales bacterium]|nr:winged helix-turn-helix domain-containing protein [Xanthomonadales bacterium]
MTEGSAHQGAWQVGDLWVDPGSARVVREGADIELPELSFRLLLALIEAAPERLSKDQLIAAVWRGGVVSDETLTQRVRLLRQALGDSPSAPRYLRGAQLRLSSDRTGRAGRRRPAAPVQGRVSAGWPRPALAAGGGRRAGTGDHAMALVRPSGIGGRCTPGPRGVAAGQSQRRCGPGLSGRWAAR